jgi:hypothetical protein
MIKRLSTVILFISIACPWTLPAQSRLQLLVEDLARTASTFMEDSYRSFRNRDAGNRADVEALYLVQQFDAGAQLLFQMMRDRRPASELGHAAAILSEQVRSAQRFAYGQRTWKNLSRILEDISRELGGYSSASRDRERSEANTSVVTGRMRWRGRIDDEVEIHIRRDDAVARVISGQPVLNASFTFTSPLPNRSVIVQLAKKKGRGSVEVVQQPSRSNEFTAVVRIQDDKGGASDYEFELIW